jgi:hypothetical protein
MPSGGYHPPAHPAPVSGPGSLSRRTDGGPHQVISTVPNQPYGDAKQQALQQQTAPMAGKAPLPPAPPVAPAAGPPSADPSQPQAAPPYQGGAFGGPTNMPGQPVTHGSPIGPGAGPEALQLGPMAGATGHVAPTNGAMTQLLTNLSARDTTGVLAQLLQNASAQGA